jgi:hypothetical protein
MGYGVGPPQPPLAAYQRPCQRGGVEEKPRFAVRRGAVALSRLQWIVLGGILVTGIALTAVLVAAVSPAAGGICLGTTAVAACLIIGSGRPPQRDD